jgi:DNA-binding MarR family transcriptional regulator
MPGATMAETEILRAIERAGQLLGRYLSARLAQLAITDAEAHLLMHLPVRGPVSLSELQRLFALRPSTLTHVIDRLEHRGLVTRHLNPRDRRSFLVVLTPEGERVAAEVIALMQGVEAALRSHVQAGDVAGFFAVMGALDEVTMPEAMRDGRARPDHAESVGPTNPTRAPKGGSSHI